MKTHPILLLYIIAYNIVIISNEYSNIETTKTEKKIFYLKKKADVGNALPVTRTTDAHI